MKELAVVGDEYFVLGFQLVGVQKGFIVDKRTATSTLEQVLDRDDLGIVITNSATFAHLSERLKERAMVQVRPTVVVLSHDVSAEQNLRLLIRRALGIDVWAQKGAAPASAPASIKGGT